MKKEKQPSPVKAARKAIQGILLTEINNITEQLQKQGITTDVDADKEAKKLAKRITKGAKAIAAPETKPVAAETKAPEKKAAPAKEKAAPKAPEKKAEPAKAAAPKAPAAKATKATAPVAAPALKAKTTKATGSK